MHEPAPEKQRDCFTEACQDLTEDELILVLRAHNVEHQVSNELEHNNNLIKESDVHCSITCSQYQASSEHLVKKEGAVCSVEDDQLTLPSSCSCSACFCKYRLFKGRLGWHC